MSRSAVEDLPGSRDEQAAEWCMRLAEGQLRADEQRVFDAWLADPHNRVSFEEAETVWRGVETAADKPEFIRCRSQALESFRRANRRRWASRFSADWRWSAALAAGLLIAVVGTVFLATHSTQTYETGIAERRVVTLDDGSQLSLDAATRVEARLADERRELHLLQGRARFDVAKDPLRPFSVAAGNKVVVAIGTSFSVELLERQMHVVLYEGRVEVIDEQPAAPLQSKHSKVASSTLLPGRELIASLDTAAAHVVDADVARSLSWESGQLNFVNEPLASAVERMNRYSKEKLVIGDPAVEGYEINGVFTAGDAAALVEGVTTFFPVRADREGGQVVLRLATGKNPSQGTVPRAR